MGARGYVVFLLLLITIVLLLTWLAAGFRLLH
jgi:hypothetical protein